MYPGSSRVKAIGRKKGVPWSAGWNYGANKSQSYYDPIAKTESKKMHDAQSSFPDSVKIALLVSPHWTAAALKNCSAEETLHQNFMEWSKG